MPDLIIFGVLGGLCGFFIARFLSRGPIDDWDGWIPGDPEEDKPADWKEQRKVYLDRKYNRDA